MVDLNLLPSHRYRATNSADNEDDGVSIEEADPEWIEISYSYGRFNPDNLKRVGAFRIIVVTVGGLVAIGLIVAAVLLYKGYASLVSRAPDFSPKLATKRTPIQQQVLSLFGPKEKGSRLDHFDVGVIVWHRVGVKPEPPSWWREDGPIHINQKNKSEEVEDEYTVPEWYQWDMDSSGGPGEIGYARPSNGSNLNPWVPVFHQRVFKNLAATTSSPVSKQIDMVLPKELIKELSINPFSDFVATFAMLPPVSDPLNTELTNGAASSFSSIFNTSRPAENYGIVDKDWPLAWVEDIANTELSPIASFFAHSGAGYRLKIETWPDPDVGTATSDRGSIDVLELRRPVVELNIVSSTVLAMASDFPAYERQSYNAVMGRLREFKEKCGRYDFWMPHCTRSFKRDGHSENSLKLNTNLRAEPWYYGPFLTSRFSSTTKKHLVKLERAKKDTSRAFQDLHYPWHITFSPMSPAMMAITTSLLPEWGVNRLDPFGRRPHEKDYLEVFHSFIGHNFNPRAHPFARTALGFVSLWIQYLTVPLILHYWFVRFHSGGTSYMIFLLSYGNLTWMILQSIYNFDEISLLWFIVKILAHVALLLKQMILFTGVEFRWEGWAPRAVRFRSPTKLELQTREADSRIPWFAKAIFVIFVFAQFNFGPKLPSVVHSPNHEDVLAFGRLWNRHSAAKTRMVLIGGSFQSSLWLTASLSQIYINYRLRKYGAEYRWTAFLNASSFFLSRLSSMFINFFGPAASTTHFTVWDTITLWVHIVLVIQCCLYNTVSGKRSEANIGATF